MRLLHLFLLFGLPALATAAPPLLTVTSPGHRLDLTAAEFSALPRTELTATDPHEKTGHRYAGVPLHEFLQRLAVPQGKQLRGTALQLAVLVRGADGYSAVFSVAELDADFGNARVLVSDRADDTPWNARFGPLRLIVPGDRFAARWVRNVCSMELITVGTVVPRPPHP